MNAKATRLLPSSVRSVTLSYCNQDLPYVVTLFLRADVAASPKGCAGVGCGVANVTIALIWPNAESDDFLSRAPKLNVNPALGLIPHVWRGWRQDTRRGVSADDVPLAASLSDRLSQWPGGLISNVASACRRQPCRSLDCWMPQARIAGHHRVALDAAAGNAGRLAPARG